MEGIHLVDNLPEEDTHLAEDNLVDSLPEGDTHLAESLGRRLPEEDRNMPVVVHQEGRHCLGDCCSKFCYLHQAESNFIIKTVSFRDQIGKKKNKKQQVIAS